MNKVFDWSEYWLNEGVTGECFVDSKGNKNNYLSKFWYKEIRNNKNLAKVIDLASGAGSIFAGNIDEENDKYYAVDVSQDALNQLKSRMPNVKTLVNSIDNVNLPSAEFDLVVSQFGIEYAGANAFIEAARLLKANGKLVLLSHIKDGFIDSKNQTEYEGVSLLNSSDFINKSIEVTKARFEADKNKFKQKFSEFIAIEPVVSKWALTHKTGLLSHAYFGFRKMYENINSYVLADLIDWLEGINDEKQKSEIRLKEMLNAALTQEKVESHCNLLRESGLFNIEFKPFLIPNQSLPIAWLITGHK